MGGTAATPAPEYPMTFSKASEYLSWHNKESLAYRVRPKEMGLVPFEVFYKITIKAKNKNFFLAPSVIVAFSNLLRHLLVICPQDVSPLGVIAPMLKIKNEIPEALNFTTSIESSDTSPHSSASFYIDKWSITLTSTGVAVTDDNYEENVTMEVSVREDDERKEYMRKVLIHSRGSGLWVRDWAASRARHTLSYNFGAATLGDIEKISKFDFASKYKIGTACIEAVAGAMARAGLDWR